MSTSLERPEYNPWVLVNLLRFNPRVTSKNGEVVTGAVAYRRYIEAATPVLERFGGEVLWAGDAQFAVAGLSPPTHVGDRSQWDRVVIVRYPTPAAYRAFVGDPEMRRALTIKQEAVAETEVLVCTPDGRFEPQVATAGSAPAD